MKTAANGAANRCERGIGYNHLGSYLCGQAPHRAAPIYLHISACTLSECACICRRMVAVARTTAFSSWRVEWAPSVVHDSVERQVRHKSAHLPVHGLTELLSPPLRSRDRSLWRSLRFELYPAASADSARKRIAVIQPCLSKAAEGCLREEPRRPLCRHVHLFAVLPPHLFLRGRGGLSGLLWRGIGLAV